MTNEASVTCRLLAAVVLLGALNATTHGAKSDANGKLLREGQANLWVFDPATLPPDVSPKLFGGEISGNTFELFIREVPAQTLTIELGFVDTQNKDAGQRTFSLSANGTPLDANLDVWSKAGGTFKPWVFKTTYQHAGGSLAIQFAGLDKPAFVSYARILDGTGKELAAGVADPSLMTQEELQNWIVCATFYWKATGDNAWVEQNKATFKLALESMQHRDDVDPAKRDGITSYVSSLGEKADETTTYDAMDASLRSLTNSLYIAIKSFSCYAMLQPLFRQFGENAAVQQAQAAGAYTAKGILAHWDEQRHSLPTTFDSRPHSSATTKPQAINGRALNAS